MDSVFKSNVRCHGKYIDRDNTEKVEFKEGYILNITHPIITFGSMGYYMGSVGYVIALPDGQLKFALIWDITIDMLGVHPVNG